MSNPLAGRDLISINDFTLEEIELVMTNARWMETTYNDRSDGPKRIRQILGETIKILQTLFYEASLRTRTSFEAAMMLLGGQVISYSDAGKTTKASVGESLKDTGTMLDCYADIAVIRHGDEGAAAVLAKGATISIINGGDGRKEHPTQTLTDLYIMMKHFRMKRLESLQRKRVALIGDLKRGRTVHSLGMVLARIGATIDLVSPAPLAMPVEYTKFFDEQGATWSTTDDLSAALKDPDVLYWTRVQIERAEDEAERAALEQCPPYILTPELYQSSGAHGIILHPLPRIDEIDPRVDDLKQALYVKQAEGGLYVRMALLALLLGATPSP